MTITDTSPLVALLIRRDPDHQACVQALPQLRAPLITTWPVFTETLHFLGREGGWFQQNAMWQWVLHQRLILVDLTPEQLLRAHQLMEQYADTPMDLADASLVALAEARKLRRLFTLDSDFHVYRLNGRTAFQVVP